MNWRIYIQENQWAGPWYRRVQQQPGWVTRLAIGAATLVIVVPVVILTVAAVVVGLAVFFTFGIIASLVRIVAGLFSRNPANRYPTSKHDGRENVRVIDERH